VHIRCAECAAVDLCIECFATGSESGDLPAHKRTHAYRVMDNLNALALTVDADWTAREEFMLLDGIDMYGVGNWRCVQHLVRLDNGCASLAVAPASSRHAALRPFPPAVRLRRSSAARRNRRCTSIMSVAT